MDYNNLFSDMSQGKDFYDGLVDITHASDYVSVSWNYLHDHYNFDSRTPSLRFGTGHVFNNYFVSCRRRRRCNRCPA